MAVKRRGGEKDANYFYRFQYKGHDFCEGGFRTSAQASEAERLAMNKAVAQKLHPEDYAGEMTFRQAGGWWLTEYAVFKRSKKNDFCRMPILMDYFGNKLLREIQPPDIDTFLVKLPELRAATYAGRGRKTEGLGDHTRNHYLALIRALYNRLKHKRMYKGENPAEFVDKIEVPQARCRFIYPSEEKILTPAMARNADLFSYYRLGIETGMRIGEMMAIRIKQVDFVMSHIFLPHPKNNRSRYVPFEASLEPFLRVLAATKGPEDHLLPQWGYTYILDHFKIICGATGMKLRKGEALHLLRHTFAYHKLSHGTPLYKVSLLMGHSSQDVTQKHYGHLAIKDLRDAMEQVPSFLSCNRIATGPSKVAEKEVRI